MPTYGHDIIVIGASAGGVETLIKLVHLLPEHLPAAIFVVLHIPAEGPDLLPRILSRSGPLLAIHPTDHTPIESGQIYIAPPDHHMLLEANHIRITRGPKENRHRPAVDPLFRSAALEYGTRVVAVILTGALDDGTAGLQAVKQRGGITIVQDPEEALYPSMPQHALNYVQVDHCLPLADIPPLLVTLAQTPVEDDNAYPVSRLLTHEVSMAKMDKITSDNEHPEGDPSVFSCPACGGVLWELQDGKLTRFRCRVGHSFTPESIQISQTEALENALWTAYKTLEESTNFSRRMADQAKKRGQTWLVDTYETKAQVSENHANIIRDVLLKDNLNPP